MARKLRYSERRALVETGSAGPLQDQPSLELINALNYLIGEGTQSAAGKQFANALHGACVKHFGWGAGVNVRVAILAPDLDDFLELMEIVCEEALRHHNVGGNRTLYRPAIYGAEEKINDLFDRHRFGYRLDAGEIRKVGSPALSEVVVGPALLAVQRPGWEEADRSFREAIQHQRGGPDENDDALTAANAAIEAALKAAGFKGANLGPLAKDFKKSSVVPPELKDVPEALDLLLKRSGAMRNSHGDSHGKAPGADAVPQELVDLAIHWAGAFIVYLSRAIPEAD